VEKGDRKVLLGMKLDADRPGGDKGGDIRSAKVKKIDLDKMTLTLTVDGKDHDFLLTEDTQVLGAQGKDLKERLKDFKEGSEVQFKSGTRDGKDVLVGLKLGGAGERKEQPKVDTSKFKPLTELGTEEYQGYKGGLYPESKNE